MSDLTIMLDEPETKEVSVVSHEKAMPANLDISDVKARVDLIKKLLQDVMVEGEHYGKIPGCKKDILMKSGAEKIGLMFRLIPKYTIERIDHKNGHREYSIICTLMHNGEFAGQGLGSCSSLESKYRYRDEKRTCPACGADAIINGKEEYGGGWLCWKKKNGCGASFSANDPQITGQKIGRTGNPDIADQYNTILKMAKKRAHVDAIITAAGASDIFTQDIEDDGNTTHSENEKPELAKPKYTPHPKGNTMPKLSAADAKEKILQMLKEDKLGIFSDDEKNEIRKRIATDRPYSGGWIALHDRVKEKIEKGGVI